MCERKAQLGMSGPAHNLLLIDDDPRHAKALRKALVATGGDPSNLEWVRTLSIGLDRVSNKHVRDIWAIFLNLSLPDSRGINTFERLSAVNSTYSHRASRWRQ